MNTVNVKQSVEDKDRHMQSHASGNPTISVSI